MINQLLILGYDAGAVFSRLQDAADYKGIEDVFYPSEDKQDQATISYSEELLGAVVYSHANRRMAKEFCNSMEDLTKCVDGQWLGEASIPMKDLTLASRELVAECRLDTFNFTVPARTKHIVLSLLILIDLTVHSHILLALAEKIKSRKEVDPCSEVQALLRQVETFQVRNIELVPNQFLLMFILP